MIIRLKIGLEIVVYLKRLGLSVDVGFSGDDAFVGSGPEFGGMIAAMHEI